MTLQYLALRSDADRLPAISTLSPRHPGTGLYPLCLPKLLTDSGQSRTLALGDFLRPVLHQTHGLQQIYITSLLGEVLGEGPAGVATALIFLTTTTSAIVAVGTSSPLWRDTAGTKANVTEGVLTQLSVTYGRDVTAEESFFAFAYAVLATPRYVRHFWEELQQPLGRACRSRRTGNSFSKLAAAGRELVWLHTFGGTLRPGRQACGRGPAGEVEVPHRHADSRR